MIRLTMMIMMVMLIVLNIVSPPMAMSFSTKQHPPHLYNRPLLRFVRVPAPPTGSFFPLYKWQRPLQSYPSCPSFILVATHRHLYNNPMVGFGTTTTTTTTPTTTTMSMSSSPSTNDALPDPDETTTTTTTSTTTMNRGIGGGMVMNRNEVERSMKDCLIILTRAASTRQEDSNTVYTALVDLERYSRIMAQTQKVASPIKNDTTNEGNINNDDNDDDNNHDTDHDDYTYAKQMREALHGSWRLVFTTGTAESQKRWGGAKINYFPLKAIQTFDTCTMTITNGIYVGDTNFCALRFAGTFTFDLRKRRLEFDFDTVTLFQFLDITLQRGQAAQLGAASGLGAKSNVINAQPERNKQAFSIGFRPMLIFVPHVGVEVVWPCGNALLLTSTTRIGQRQQQQQQ